ncbi:MAG: hypothetical protein AAGB34_07075 [Planctomycetota bacterium]
MQGRPLVPVLIGSAATFLLACSGPELRADFDSLSPAERARAIAIAAQNDDDTPRTVASLIEELDAADPAVRMLAAHTLRDLTGESFDYDYAAHRRDREAAVQRWADWYLKNHSDHPNIAE